MLPVPLEHYLVVAGILFVLGVVGVIVRRNAIVTLMSIELMLNAANLLLIVFARVHNDIGGQVSVFFVLVVAAAEVVIGLGIIVALMRRRPGATADDARMLKG